MNIVYISYVVKFRKTLHWQPNLNLSIGFLNIESISGSKLGCKLVRLKDCIFCDIEILAETWGKCNDYELEHYNFFKTGTRKDRSVKKGRSSGGVTVYYKKYLEKLIKNIRQTPNYIWIEINKELFHNLDKVKLWAIYNPPTNSSRLMEDITLDILKECENESLILLMGDINARTGNTNDFPLTNKHELSNYLLEDNHPHTDGKNCDILIIKEYIRIILDLTCVLQSHQELVKYSQSSSANLFILILMASIIRGR